MNIEESIRFIKELLENNYLEDIGYLREDGDYKFFNKAIETLLTVYEKQQKEIEELKTDRDKFKKALGKRITYCNELEKDLFENCNNYVVSKDKIKAKVIEIKNRPVKDEFITATQGKLNTIIDIESLLD